MKDALDESLILSDKRVHRVSSAFHQCLTRFSRIIQDLTDEIVVDIGALYKASEAVALLDLLWSFAYASIREPFSFVVFPHAHIF